MAPKSSLLLVPGSFSLPELYDPIVEATRAKGVDIQAIGLVTAGKKPGSPPTMLDDAVAINAAATKLADEGKDVVLIAHSYGGIPTTESIKGVSKAAREKAGKKGGVVRVAYMTALVPEVGMAAMGILADDTAPPPTYIAPDADGWLFHPDPATTASLVFNDLPLEQGIEEVKKFVQHSAISFATELTYAGYNDVPASYLFCENDKCVIPEVQQKGIDTIEKASGRKVDVTRIPTDHVPNVSAPEKVVDWFVSLSEK